MEGFEEPQLKELSYLYRTSTSSLFLIITISPLLKLLFHFEIILGIFLAESIGTVFSTFSFSVLGPMLLFAGFELGESCLPSARKEKYPCDASYRSCFSYNEYSRWIRAWNFTLRFLG